jgi:mycothiol synthase
MSRNHETKHELPDGYAIRAPTTDDFRAVADLILASDVAGFGEPDYTEQELLADWQDLDLRWDAWVVAAPGGELAGYAAVENRGHGTVFAEGYVHPAHTGLGVGVYLVRLTEARAREHAARVPPGSRVVVDNTINGEDGAARRLLEQTGYEAVRHFRRMAIELEEAPPERRLPEGISIRSCVSGEDERVIFETLDEALRDHWEYTPATFESWERRKKRMGFDPGLWLLAVDGGEVAGAAVCEDRPESGWVSELAVRRPWRRHGLGLALLRRAFAEFYSRGRRKVALAVDSQSLTGATRLYERAGMQLERLYSVYRKELRSGEPPA